MRNPRSLVVFLSLPLGACVINGTSKLGASSGGAAGSSGTTGGVASSTGSTGNAASSGSTAATAGTSSTGGPGPAGNTAGLDLPPLTLSGGSQPIAVPFGTWNGATVAVSPSTTTYYVDAATGDDSNAGTGTAPFKTINAAANNEKLAAGDTVLIKAGLYRELVNFEVSGTSGAPITFGSFGDGEVIVDGSTAVTGWTTSGGTVWQATVSDANEIDAVVVNDNVLYNYSTTTGIVASGSNQWWFDGSSTLYADMGGADPSTADIFVIFNNHGVSTITLNASKYVNIIGLTVRGAGWSGIGTYPDSDTDYPEHITVAYCKVEFNDGAGVSFSGGTDDAVVYSEIYHNVLNNWPFGANGNADAGGGWPGTTLWQYEANGVSRGNVVSMNGGEGILSYGNDGPPPAFQTGNMLVEQNVSFDNWSNNIYLDNQPNHVVRQNLVFRHPPDPTWIWGPVPKDDYSVEYIMEKYRTCLSLADESGSGTPDEPAAMANAQVYDNLIIGCRTGILDYAEDVTTHGMKNDLIVNNTIVIDDYDYTQETIAGISISDNGTNNSNSLIANNIVYRPLTGSDAGNCPLVGTEGDAALTGITFNNNLYFAKGLSASDTSLFATNAASSISGKNFSQWTSFEGNDAASLYQDPSFVGAPQPAAGAVIDYTQSAAAAGSPALGLSLSESTTFTTDFAGAARGASWTAGALQ